MGRDVKHPQLPRHEHQRVAAASSPFSENLGVTRKWIAGAVHRLLIDGGRNHRVYFIGPGEIDRPEDVLHRRPPGYGGEDAGGALLEVDVLEIEHRHLPKATRSLSCRSDPSEAEPAPHIAFGPLQNIAIADDDRDDLPVDRLLSEGLQDDLWPDPGRIAHRNPYAHLASLTLHRILLAG